ncbi:hypothetical protein ACOMHN_061424 [Nucella lapillus]
MDPLQQHPRHGSPDKRVTPSVTETHYSSPITTDSYSSEEPATATPPIRTSHPISNVRSRLLYLEKYDMNIIHIH